MYLTCWAFSRINTGRGRIPAPYCYAALRKATGSKSTGTAKATFT